MQKLEKILEEIGELRGQAGSECTSEDHYIKKAWEHCLDRVVDIIRRHMNDGWIPVEERLPEEKKSVLVQWEKYDRHLNVTLTYLDVMWLEDEEDVVFETINGIPNGRVIAWCPLSEPYRPEPETEKPDWRQDMLRKFDRRSRQ